MSSLWPPISGSHFLGHIRDDTGTIGTPGPPWALSPAEWSQRPPPPGLVQSTCQCSRSIADERLRQASQLTLTGERGTVQWQLTWCRSLFASSVCVWTVRAGHAWIPTFPPVQIEDWLLSWSCARTFYDKVQASSVSGSMGCQRCSLSTHFSGEGLEGHTQTLRWLLPGHLSIKLELELLLLCFIATSFRTFMTYFLQSL